MIRCQEVITFLDRYVDGGLSAAEKAAFEAHLGICASCVNYLRNYRSAVQLVHEAGVALDQLTDVPEELVRAILAARDGRTS